MTCEFLFAVHLEVALAVIDDNLVIHGLAREVFHIRVHRGGRHCMHVRLTDVLSHYRNSKLPNVHLFVVGCRHKSATTLDKSDCVN